MLRAGAGAACQLALGIVLTACGATRHQDFAGGAESTQHGGAAAESGGPESGGSVGVASGESALVCPSLEQAAESFLLASRKGPERALIRADGAVHLRHTLPFDYAAEAYLDADAELVFAAVQSGLSVDMKERAFQIARFDAEGGLVEATQGVLPVPSSLLGRVYAPTIRQQGGSIAFDQADGDSWRVDFDGATRLRECERHTPIGPAEESGIVGAWVELEHGAREAAFVDAPGGTCRRLTNVGGNAGTASFSQGRFQYLHAVSGSLLLSDAGPSAARDFPLWPSAAGERATLHAVSSGVLYVLSAPNLARYDAVARELRIVALPSAAATFSLHGDRLVGHDHGVPIWSYDLKQQTAIGYDVPAPAGTASSLSSQDFFLISVDERPTTWLSLATAEARPFEVAIPPGAALEMMQSEASAVLVANGVPIAHVDLAAGHARALELSRSGNEAETFRQGDVAFVVLDGVPAFRVDLRSGGVEEVAGGTGLAGLARTERSGSHVIVSIAGRPRALLDAESAELVPLVGADQVPAAVALVPSERYVVGFDARNWPVFRLDVATHELSSYAVTEPADLVGFRDPQYVVAPGDTLYSEHYASSSPDAEVLEDGSVAVALRDARQGRLWLVSPEDTAFRPVGRPVTDVVALNWHTQRYSLQLAGDRGDCYCQPPTLRWEAGADVDVMPTGYVQLVARAHPSLIIVRPDYLVEQDPSGVCVVEQGALPLVHDLLAGTTRALEDVAGDVRFLPVSQ